MLQDTPSPAEIAAADEKVRAALVEEKAVAALNAAGCTAVSLVLPSVTNRLTAVFIGEGAGWDVYELDRKGEVIPGPTGPRQAADVVEKLRIQYPHVFSR